MKLRPYQKNAVRRIRRLLERGERPLCYAPTGAGKTEVAKYVLRGFPGEKLIVSHTDTLQVQNRERLERYGVQSVTIQTLLRHPALARGKSAVCWDEAHHLKADEWRKAVKLFGPTLPMIGLSATPFHDMSKVFTRRHDIARVEELIKLGVVLPVAIHRPSARFRKNLRKNQLVEGASAYLAQFKGKRAIHFESTKARCATAQVQYAQAGVAAAVVTDEVSSKARAEIFQRFERGDLQVLVSPMALAEGFDAPCAEVLVAGRPFKSDVLMHQAVGRVRRKHPGKRRAALLDCTGCCNDRDVGYFNTTDEALFGALAVDAGDEAHEPSAGATRGPARAIEWVQCDDWEVEEPTAAERATAAHVRQEAEHVARADAAHIRERKRVNMAKRRADPEKAERIRAQQRKTERKKRQDPEYLKRRRARARARSADPEKRERILAQKRASWARYVAAKKACAAAL